jgi:hypothetical protein
MRYPLLTFLFLFTWRFLSDLDHLSLHVAVLTLHLFQRSRATPQGWSDIHGSLSPKLPLCYTALNTAHISWLANLCCLLLCPFSYGILYLLIVYSSRHPSSSYTLFDIHCLFSLCVPLHLRCSLLYYFRREPRGRGTFPGLKVFRKSVPPEV